jgi:hypothetical protein
MTCRAEKKTGLPAARCGAVEVRGRWPSEAAEVGEAGSNRDAAKEQEEVVAAASAGVRSG